MPQDPQPPNGQADDTSLLTWLGFRDPFEFGTARPLGALLGCLLTLIVPLLFFGALCAAGAVLWHSIHLALSGSKEGLNLGAGALIAALLGAPFVIWGTVLKHQSLRYQKEGHITDRISKAVEQLGAEKKVDRIGRPVTIWFDALPSSWRSSEHSEHYLNTPRTKLSKPEWNEFWDPETNEHEEGQYVRVTSYQQERTVIQWQGETLHLADGEVIGSEGEWKVFSESLPNIEVRIGAILSLERIAQDSTKHDKGRDHVRIMEILCAYIRENAPATDLTPTEGEFTTKIPRIDLQMAVTVLGRRSDVQQKLEEKARYRLDLSRSDLDGMDFSKGSFRGALFNRSRVEAANFMVADLTGAQFRWTLLNFARFWNSNLIGTDMSFSTCTSTHTGAFFVKEVAAYMEGASIQGIRLSARLASRVYGTQDTIVNLNHKRDKESALEKLRRAEYAEDGQITLTPADAASLTPEEKCYLHWNPHSSSDLAVHIFRDAFRDRWNLRGWPFED